MKHFFLFLFLSTLQPMIAQVTLDADGPGDTYPLIISVLAPGQNPIEAPDCSHEDFGDHIDEIFDDELDDFVFRFHMHTDQDDDRCINFDRQRNEIKSYSPSPANLLGIEGETVRYIWKFRLPEGFQSSPNFTHLHQLKSVGGPLASQPMYTLTTRKGTPDRIELRYAETDDQITLIQTELAPFIGTWVEVMETITYGTEGSYEIEINRLEDGENLLSYSDASIINWRPDADFVRPKWGIYRSLINAQDLRDETVLYANFSIEEIETTSSTEVEIIEQLAQVIHIPETKILSLRNLQEALSSIQIHSISGQRFLNYKTIGQKEMTLDIASLTPGIYVVNLIGSQSNQSELFLISQ